MAFSRSLLGFFPPVFLKWQAQRWCNLTVLFFLLANTERERNNESCPVFVWKEFVLRPQMSAFPFCPSSFFNRTGPAQGSLLLKGGGQARCHNRCTHKVFPPFFWYCEGDGWRWWHSDLRSRLFHHLFSASDRSFLSSLRLLSHARWDSVRPCHAREVTRCLDKARGHRKPTDLEWNKREVEADWIKPSGQGRRSWWRVQPAGKQLWKIMCFNIRLYNPGKTLTSRGVCACWINLPATAFSSLSVSLHATSSSVKLIPKKKPGWRSPMTWKEGGSCTNAPLRPFYFSVTYPQSPVSSLPAAESPYRRSPTSSALTSPVTTGFPRAPPGARGGS